MKKSWIVLIIVIYSILVVEKVFCAVPVITYWSSTGGTLKNKLNAQDIMYLVTENNNLTFTVTVDQAVDYEWQVNKSTDTSVNANTFNWTVPNEKGIWEIHLKCWNGSSEEVHKEWVVSTIWDTNEAPDFFDYFTDGKWNNRTEKDPWERNLPEWINNRGVVVDTSKKMAVLNGDVYNAAYLYAPHQLSYGTLMCKFRVTPSGKQGYDERVSLRLLMFGGNSGNAGITMAAEPEGHNWAAATDYGLATSMFLVGAWGVGDGVTFGDGNWKDFKMIRNNENYFHIWKGTGLFGHNGYSVTNSMHPIPIFPKTDAFAKLENQNVAIMANSDNPGTNPYYAEIDCIEIYSDKFISKKNISYGQYVYWYKQDVSNGPLVPRYKNGIVVDGFDIRLQDIANAVSDPSKFTYNSGSKTAVCYTDLCINAGAELILNGETLKMHSNSDGEHQIVVKNSATLKIDNSTITSNTNNYYQWLFPTEYTVSYEYRSGYEINGRNRFIANNSTIDNCGGLYFLGPDTVILNNTNLTNLVNILYPAVPTDSGIFARWSAESTRFQGLTFRARQPVTDFKIKNVKISGKVKADVRFLSTDVMIGEPIRKHYGNENPIVGSVNICDSILENVNIFVRAALIMYWGYEYPTTVSLVNTKFTDLTCVSANAWILPKCYLDIKVVDKDGNPVNGANVTVVNEVNSTYIAENLQEGRNWVTEAGYGDPDHVPASIIDGANPLTRYKPQYGYPITNTLTGADGHTPLPTDKVNTFVITDYVKSNTGTTNFTYTIRAEKDGITGEIKGVNPDETWYRPDPDVPTKTVVIVLGGTSYVSDDTEGPSVSIINLKDGSKVFGKVPIKIDATDNYGVAKIEIYIDDILIYQDTTFPYEWVWDTSNTENGTYTIKVVAYDGNGNSNESVITVELIKAEGVVIYPNPYIKGKSIEEKIIFANLPKEATIRIYTLSGELVKKIKHKDTAEGGSKDWSVSGVSSGIYMYTIISSEGKKRGKVSIIK